MSTIESLFARLARTNCDFRPFFYRFLREAIQFSLVMNPTDPLTALQNRMSELGLSRAWLAENTPYSADYLRTVLAPNSQRRTARVMRIIMDVVEAEAVRREAAAAAPPPPPPDTITLVVPATTLQSWQEALMRSCPLAPGQRAPQSIAEWATDVLNRAAEKWRQKAAAQPQLHRSAGPVLNETPPPYRADPPVSE